VINAALVKLLAQYEPAVAAAFINAMNLWRNNIDLPALVKALSKNDLSGAIQALHLDPAALGPFLTELGNAFKASGSVTAKSFPAFRSQRTGARFYVGFNQYDGFAEQWLRFMSSRLITDLTRIQRDAVQVIIASGLRNKKSIEAIALDIVGRVAQGDRQGGVIGLSVPQTDAMIAATTEVASMDPELLRNYLARKLRDSRFDSYVRSALEGSPIPDDVQVKMLVSYSNRLLRLRGLTIAQTEVLPALHAGQDEAVRQAIQAGGVSSDRVKRTWKDSRDARTRDTHRTMNGQTVGYGEPFVSPSGARMMYPGDASLGAPPEERLRCRCILSVSFARGQ
jgi:hypothetical protein